MVLSSGCRRCKRFYSVMQNISRETLEVTALSNGPSVQNRMNNLLLGFCLPLFTSAPANKVVTAGI